MSKTVGGFTAILDADAVDVLQADVTRCGIGGFLEAAALCGAGSVPLSSHCTPYLHLHPCCSAGPVRNMEYFHDHVRIEHLFFDGTEKPEEGALKPDLSRPGNGLTLKVKDAADRSPWSAKKESPL